MKRTQNSRPLCVDLDGTLIKTDTLLEAIWIYLRKHPFAIFAIITWLFKGRLFFKNQIFSKVNIDVRYLPYREDLLEYLRQQKNQGRRLVLVTASPLKVAKSIASHLNIFDEVYGTDFQSNLKGQAKADLLREKFGKKKFDYIGDSTVDLTVWEQTEDAYVVTDNQNLLRRVKEKATIQKVFVARERSLFKAIAKQIRVHQWAKNILIFLPMILSHRYNELSIWLWSVQAFWAFSFASSAVYVINDMLDIESDRQHLHNRHRPLAAGDLPLTATLLFVPILIFASASLALTLSWQFSLILLAYLIITTLYSVVLKQVVLADIIVLALLYSWRVLAASIATGIQMSEWFLIFAIFFFCSLALLKRCSELILVKSREEQENPRRGYLVGDLPLLVSFGVGAGYLSVLVLALYLADPAVVSQKQYPVVLWFMCPLLLYWISRMWLKAYRGQMPTDPLVFALRDNVSYSLMIVISFLWLLSRGSIFAF
ncbi:MAG: UbiA family prenyltransferase [Oligoflexus sp.]